jgi:hypothetical protein
MILLTRSGREECKPFLNALGRKYRKKFLDEMWDIPRWYISACSNSVQYVRLLDHYHDDESVTDWWQQFHNFLLQQMTVKTAEDRLRYAEGFNKLCTLATLQHCCNYLQTKGFM